jgi:hypothetical protein
MSETRIGDEMQVFESEGDLDLMMDLEPVHNPQEPLQYIPLTKGRAKLSLEQRISLLRTEVLDLENEMNEEAVKEEAVEVPNPLTEVTHILKKAETLCKARGIPGQVGVLSPDDVSTRIGKALVNMLPQSEALTYEIQGTYSTDQIDAKYKKTELLAKLSSRLRRLEETVGYWHPEHNYVNIYQAIGYIRKKLTLLNPKKLDSINTHAEDVRNEFDMLTSQLELLQGDVLDSRMVDELYDDLNHCFEMGTYMPEVLARLDKIKKVHEEGSMFPQRMKELRELHRKLNEKIQTLGINATVEGWQEFKEQAQAKLNSLKI